ncbi:MAG TPA: 16S rRNA (guanine(966)-N(2))-methyltransferase RsmD [Porphyromonadaceae bacterium]|nr:16S rRNA (guanine(966)-N(2))-methyltransferase RsmD [Porphyromonadaceae bacterium]
MRIISGIYRGKRFELPAGFKARPTTDFAREGLFDILSNRFDFSSLHALDLFAGTGAISLELSSRGAERVVCVEMNRLHFLHIKQCIKSLQDTSVVPICGDVFRYIKAEREQFNFIFADPPYDLSTLEDIPERVLSSNLLLGDGLFVLEHSKKNDFSSMPEFVEKRVYGNVNFSFFKHREVVEEEGV